LRKTGAYRPNGVRGDWGLGARPPGTRLLNAAAPIQFLPPHLVFECCGPAPQGCRKAFLAFRLATLPRAGTPWEGKRGVEVWLCAPLLFKCAPQRTAAGTTGRGQNCPSRPRPPASAGHRGSRRTWCRRVITYFPSSSPGAKAWQTKLLIALSTAF
jgi:hypothetical protein